MNYLKNLTRQLDAAENLVFKALLAAEVGLWKWAIATDTVTWDNQLMNLFEMDRNYFENGYQGYKEMVLPEYHAELEQKLHDCITKQVPLSIIYKVKSKNPRGYKTVLVKGNIVIDDQNRNNMHGVVIELPI